MGYEILLVTRLHKSKTISHHMGCRKTKPGWLFYQASSYFTSLKYQRIRSMLQQSRSKKTKDFILIIPQFYKTFLWSMVNFLWIMNLTVLELVPFRATWKNLDIITVWVMPKRDFPQRPMAGCLLPFLSLSWCRNPPAVQSAAWQWGNTNPVTLTAGHLAWSNHFDIESKVRFP